MEFVKSNKGAIILYLLLALVTVMIAENNRRLDEKHEYVYLER